MKHHRPPGVRRTEAAGRLHNPRVVLITRTFMTKKRIARLALLMAILGGPLATAADFSVSNHNDTGAGSLRAAIESLNVAGAGTHSITFASGLDPIALVSNLPMITGIGQTITINGAGNTVSGENTARLFFVAGGDVTIENMTLKQGLSDGGDGGGGGGA